MQTRRASGGEKFSTAPFLQEEGASFFWYLLTFFPCPTSLSFIFLWGCIAPFFFLLSLPLSLLDFARPPPTQWLMIHPLLLSTGWPVCRSGVDCKLYLFGKCRDWNKWSMHISLQVRSLHSYTLECVCLELGCFVGRSCTCLPWSVSEVRRFDSSGPVSLQYTRQDIIYMQGSSNKWSQHLSYSHLLLM